MNSVRFFVVGFSLIVSGCASGGLEDFGNVLSGAPVNYASGSVLGARLPEKDQRDLKPIFIQAVSNGTNGERFDWRGAQSFGWVRSGERMLGNLRPDENDRLTYPTGLSLDYDLETEKGLYVLTRNANVRLGPSTEFKVVRQLQSGDGVDVIGEVVGENWMLASIDNEIVGYIYADLMIKAPGTELELAGGPTRKPTPCRAFEQRISFDGRSDRWNGVACLENADEWVLTARPANAPVLLN